MRLYKPKPLNHTNAYRRYKARNKTAKTKIDSVVEYRRLTNKLFEIIADELIDREGGVYIKGLGYFAVVRSYHKMTKFREVEGNWLRFTDYLMKTKGYHYSPFLFNSFLSHQQLCRWTMNLTFSRNIRKRITEKIAKGHQYKFYYEEIRNTFKKGKKKWN